MAATVKPKALTPQGVSALLKKAGFTRSESAERGSACSGFVVRKDWTRDSAVRVRHQFLLMSTDRNGTRRAEELARYAKAITDAGWDVETGEYELIVTVKAQ
jgi:hypothetical protein